MRINIFFVHNSAKMIRSSKANIKWIIKRKITIMFKLMKNTDSSWPNTKNKENYNYNKKDSHNSIKYNKIYKTKKAPKYSNSIKTI